MTAALALVPTAAQAAQGSQTFSYTGAPQTFTVPEGVCELVVDAFGAAGGTAVYGSPGGRGGEVSGTVRVNPGDQLTIDVGGAGTGGNLDTGEPAAGGYGGGGRPGGYREDLMPGNGTNGGGGGGATTISLGTQPLVIAGGGGGGAGSFAGGTEGRGGDGGQNGTDGATPNEPGAGGGGASGGNGGAGGPGGQPVTDSDLPGLPGGDAQGRSGGNGAVNLADPHMGSGGGGGGGAQGGGAGGSSSGSSLYGGGGGGGSSLGPAGATYTTGVREGNGEVTLSYDTESCGVPPTPEPCPKEKLRVDKVADRTKVSVGEPVRYRIRVTNTCDRTFLDATVTDDLTDVLDNGSLAGPIRATTGTVRRVGDTLVWTGDLDPGETATISYTVIARTPGFLRNMVTWRCKSAEARLTCTDSTIVKVVHKSPHKPRPW
ncbi:hypothetical protein [Nonomuraea sp. NPDC001831]|uniref:DUF7927 domain-containing protein n=1 Tax=Nonomuraea sp. NPDC001831 TaxID=3364340 RepID=UPI003690CE7C